MFKAMFLPWIDWRVFICIFRNENFMLFAHGLAQFISNGGCTTHFISIPYIKYTDFSQV